MSSNHILEWSGSYFFKGVALTSWEIWSITKSRKNEASKFETILFQSSAQYLLKQRMKNIIPMIIQYGGPPHSCWMCDDPSSVQLLQISKGTVQHVLNIDLEVAGGKDAHGNKTMTPHLEDSKEQCSRLFCGKVISSQQKSPETG